MRRKLVLVALALSSGLALPASGGAKIRLYQGIGKLRLGMTSTQVVRALGKPDGVDPDPSGKKGPRFQRLRQRPVLSLLGLPHA